jgi:arabinonate dehydratase
MNSPRALRLNAQDNVLVAVDEIRVGDTPSGGPIASARVPKGHKIATTPIETGAPILKFGQIIGFASKPIAPGEWVHEHNVAMHEFARDYHFSEGAKPEIILPVSEQATFEGYRRANGKVGVRNYLGVLTSVNCSATVARHIAEAAERSGLLDDYPDIDGVVPITHNSGCGMAASGEGYELLKRTLWGTAGNPNFGGVLLVGLGCEVLQIGRMKADYGLDEGETFQSFTIQDTGGTRRAIEEGLSRLRDMLPIVGAARRAAQPASEIMLGLQCGGSDAWSGVTSNPALGVASDRLVGLGGTVILSETPEIYGAEHLLIARARSETVSDKLRARIVWWEAYTARHGGEMDNNPAPGNKAGGLTTILEKSLGAVAKAGGSVLEDVAEYAEPIKTRGLVFMDSPGFDPCSATGQVASGANMIAFTTGRGSAFGFKPSPSIKLSSNSEIYRRMTDDIDIDCGGIATGEATIEEKGAEILDYLLEIASGRQSKSEALGYGGAEFVPWHIGAVM